MRVLVCGGRDYPENDPADFEVIEEVLDMFEVGNEVVFITGCASGADQIPLNISLKAPRTKKLLFYPADWKNYGKPAGMIRNKQMLDDGKPDLVIAFPGGKGTGHMVSVARKAGVRVVEIKENT